MADGIKVQVPGEDDQGAGFFLAQPQQGRFYFVEGRLFVFRGREVPGEPAAEKIGTAAQRGVAQQEQKSPDLRLKNDDDDDETDIDELPENTGQHVHFQKTDQAPDGIENDDPDENIEGNAAPQQLVDAVDQVPDDEDVEQIQQIGIQKTFLKQKQHAGGLW